MCTGEFIPVAAADFSTKAHVEAGSGQGSHQDPAPRQEVPLASGMYASYAMGTQFQPMYMVPVMVPYPVYFSQSEQSPSAPTEAPAFVASQLERFGSSPRHAFCIKNTFVSITEKAPASKRRSSCPANVLRLEHPRTVVMLANLPNRAKLEKVHAHLARMETEIVDIEMPIDKRTGVNRGYAFLKFGDEASALRFMVEVQGTQVEGSNSKKKLTATFANRREQVMPLDGSSPYTSSYTSSRRVK